MIMITDVDCGLLLQLTRQLVNLSTRKPVNSSTTSYDYYF